MDRAIRLKKRKSRIGRQRGYLCPEVIKREKKAAQMEIPLRICVEASLKGKVRLVSKQQTFQRDLEHLHLGESRSFFFFGNPGSSRKIAE